MDADLRALLEDQEVLRSTDLVRSGYSIRRLPGRHTVHQIVWHDGSIIVKHVTTSGPRGSPAYEAELYRELSAARSQDATSRQQMPTRIGSRPDGVLILEKVDGPLLAEALFEEHGFNATALAMSLGELVAHVHRLFDSGDTPGLGLDGRYIPSIFEHLFPITDTFLALTGAQIEILRTIQKFPELRRVVKELQTGWDGFAFIHGDLSLSNVLIRKATSEIVLLDWELAGLGDPRWDVGTVVAEWLGHWISSIPIVKGGTVNHLAQAATSLHQSVIIRIQEFWSAYAEAMQLQGITRQLWLTSAIQFAGVRLFQKAMEHGYQLPAMTGHEQLLMQLGMNLALKPSQAATSLFGTVVPGDA